MQDEVSKTHASTRRVLFVRLSSFGDIIQCLFAADALKAKDPTCEIHWVVRSDFASLLPSASSVSQVWSFDRKSGLGGWLKLCLQLRKLNFESTYDAHNNLRSAILMIVLFFGRSFDSESFARRSKDRLKRFLFFRFRMATLPRPFRGAFSFIEPLGSWGVKPEIVPISPQPSPSRPYAVLAPSAAWDMKRWPIEHWRTLIKELSPVIPIELVGGPEDHFIETLYDKTTDPTQNSTPQVRNRSGQLSYAETQTLVQEASLVISADTGVMHLADYWARPTIALIGPTAFGYPARSTSRVLEVDLNCKPCSKDGRGNCKNTVYQLCMKSITPDWVLKEARQLLQKGPRP